MKSIWNWERMEIWSSWKRCYSIAVGERLTPRGFLGGWGDGGGVGGGGGGGGGRSKGILGGILFCGDLKGGKDAVNGLFLLLTLDRFGEETEATKDVHVPLVAFNLNGLERLPYGGCSAAADAFVGRMSGQPMRCEIGALVTHRQRNYFDDDSIRFLCVVLNWFVTHFFSSSFFFFGYISISLSSFIQCYQLTLINWLSSNYRYWFTVVIVVSSATRSFVCSWFSKGINWDSFIDSKSQGSFMGFTAWYASITTVIEDSLTWQQGAGIEGEATAIYP